MQSSYFRFCAWALATAALVTAQPVNPVEFTAAQAADGKAAYDRACASCHGRNLDDGEFAPPLRGVTFNNSFAGKTVEEYYTYISTKMPPSGPGSLGGQQYTNILTYLLANNGFAAGTRAMSSDTIKMAAMRIPGVRRGGAGGGLTPGVALPGAPPPSPLLDRLTPVTDAMLAKPAPSEWLTWRRTWDAQGYSPLKLIDRTNVKNLRLAWSWSLPPGPNTAAPLVHDGVLFVQGYGDQVQALDAATGDLLWHWQRPLPEGLAGTVKKNIALYGGNVILSTSDDHMIALDAKTGRVVWDTTVVDYKTGLRMTGGPLVAKGKVMIGTGGQVPGGNFIVGLDAATGKEAWRVRTIPVPGTPGGDSWNGLPQEKRTGGSVWDSGSYDPELNLTYWGAAPTYDTGPLRIKNPGMNNDALYSDSTIAINPDTGKIAWHYQHMVNDQWDYDWIFERTLVKLPVNGQTKTLSVTAGKIALFDAVDASNGQYQFSLDLGLQNIITAIDPKTGTKTNNQGMIPGDGEPKIVCPHAGGARNWLPTAYNPETKILYTPIVETCMDLVPVPKNERGFLTTGVRVSMRPRLDSDGKYGRIHAVNLETKKTVFLERERAPETSGVLATAGGLIFVGSIDRNFSAFDDRTGKELWHARLNDVPGSTPITFQAGGKQYVAITVGAGSPHSTTWPALTPEIQNPPGRGGTVWVFELP